MHSQGTLRSLIENATEQTVTSIADTPRMKFETTPGFDADYKRLSNSHRRMFHERLGGFSAGCDTWLNNGAKPHPWPGNLRVHMLSNTDLWSMTWHYRRPDGRATFQFIETGDSTKVRWRRIGGHEIYDEAE